MLESAEVTRQFLQTVIHIIGRKTSEEYAAVTIGNLLKKLKLKYSFIREMEIRDTRFLELESSVAVNDSLNDLNPETIGNALKDLIKMIMSSMGKTAGYFFIREIREKIGADYEEVLVKTMDVDLTLLQATTLVEKKSVNLLSIEKSDVARRVLKTLIELVEKQTSKTFALGFIARRVDALRQRYPFLGGITIQDIRYTLGVDEVVVQQEINDVDSMELGKAIQSLLNDTEDALINLGRVSILDDLKMHLTNEYLAKLEELGVKVIAHGVGYDMIFRHIIKALIDVLGKTSTEAYAIYAMNTFLRKTDGSYEFLKQVKIDQAADPHEVYRISIMNNFDSLSETDVRRAIQQLLEVIVSSLGEKPGNQFIQDFKDSLEKKYLLKLEEIGVNLHMIELHQELVAEREQSSLES